MCLRSEKKTEAENSVLDFPISTVRDAKELEEMEGTTAMFRTTKLKSHFSTSRRYVASENAGLIGDDQSVKVFIPLYSPLRGG